MFTLIGRGLWKINMIAAYSVNGRKGIAAGAALGVLFFALAQAAATPAMASDTAAKAATHAAKPSKQPALAEPTRPIALPTLPGSGEDGVSLHVTSTEEEDIKKQAAEDAERLKSPPQPEHAAAEPDDEDDDTPTYSEQNWRPAKKVSAESAHETEGGDHKTQLRVRLPGLPDVRVTPPVTDEAAAPPPPPPSAAKASRAALLEEYKRAKDAEETARAKQAKDEKKEKAKTPEEEAACNALQAYKERQLNAIKSDNATLKALQDAISALGYEKQLNYMKGSGDMMSLPSTTPAGQATTTAHDTVAKPATGKKTPAHATN